MRPFATLRFISLSSTTRISALRIFNCRLLISSPPSAICLWNSPIGESSSTFWINLNENAEPSPYLLSTERLLFISLSIPSTIDIPSPVPSIFLFFFSSRRWKDWNSLSISSSLIPIPVSLTSTKSSLSLFLRASSLIVRVTVPFSVYFTALVSRLTITCFILTSSP